MRPALIVAMVGIALPSSNSLAQGVADYPTKAVRVIVPVSPGGGLDITTRLFAQKLTENLKRSFVVDNRAGGGSTIGQTFAARSTPDGYTLLAAANGFTIAPALYPNLAYDPVRDFVPISLVSKGPFILLAHPALPVRSVKELIALARSRPGALDMGVASGGGSHLAAAWFVAMANVKVAFIPYKGSGPVTIDTIAGQIHVFFGNVLTNLPHVRSGRLRALAVSGAERSAVLPELPTIAESGLRGYDVTAWTGWLAPAGTPSAIVDKLSAELAKVVRSPDIMSKLAEDGGEPVGSTPAQFQSLIAAEIPRWRNVAKGLGLRAE